MNRSWGWGALLVVLGLLAGFAGWGVTAFMGASDADRGISPEKVADHLHAVIQASRAVYATDVVDKLQSKGVVEAAEHWKQEDALPLPAQFLIETGRLASERGTGLKYRLVSLWPIYVWNAPSAEFERKRVQAAAQ